MTPRSPGSGMIDPLGRPAGALAFAVLCALGLWAGLTERASAGLLRALQDPAAHAGETLRVWREARVAEVSPGRVVVRENAYGPAARVVVRGLTEPVAVGDNITLVGRFEPPDGLAVTAFRVHRTRLVKVWVSLPVLAWLAWACVTRVRATRAGLVERTPESA